MDTQINEEYLYSPSFIDPFASKGQESPVEDGTKVTLASKNIKYDLVIVKRLGKGGFGSVYKCVDSHGSEFALKKIKTDSNVNRGVPCLFEASMMSVYNHPSINHALIVNADPSGLYILQDLAKCDLSGLYELNNHTISMLQYKNILYRVSKALSYLHNKGLVHGDVKSKNVLYYNDDDIRLSDFNLTTMKKWQSNIHLCTAIYRPLEVWEDKDWNEKIDIWSFGCMMYEMLYQRSLFSYQGQAETRNERRDLRRKYVNAIIDWSLINSPGHIKTIKWPIGYRALDVVSEIAEHKATDILGKSKGTYDYDKELYINLMLRCLQVLDKHRPPIDTVISDPFFQVVRSKQIYQAIFKVNEVKEKINQDFYNIIERDLINYVEKNNRELLRVATYICYNYAKAVGYDNHIIKRVSVWMAKKLLRIDAKSQEIPTLSGGVTRDQVIKMEFEICKALGFKLHT